MAGYNTMAFLEPGLGFDEFPYSQRNDDEVVPESQYVESSGYPENSEFQACFTFEENDYHQIHEQCLAGINPSSTMKNHEPTHMHEPASLIDGWEEHMQQDHRAQVFPYRQYYGANSASEWHAGSNGCSTLPSNTAAYADGFDEQPIRASQRTQALQWSSSNSYLATTHQPDSQGQPVPGPTSFNSPPVVMRPILHQGYGMTPTVSHHSTDQLRAHEMYHNLTTPDNRGWLIPRDAALPHYSTSSDMENTLQSEGGDSDMDQSIPQDEGDVGEGRNEQIRVGGDRRPRLPMSKIPFEATIKVQSIYDEGGQAVPVNLRCDMPRTFGYLDKEGTRRWVAYRRNYFQPFVSIELEPPSSNDQGYLTTEDTYGRMTPILGFRARLRGYNNQNNEVEMVVFTAKRKPLYTGWGMSNEKTGPAPVRLRPTEKRTGRVIYPKSTGDLSLKTEHKFERPQFKASTDNNGMRRSGQTYYHVRVEVEAEVQGDDGETEWVLVASCRSGPLITRGRSPKSFEAPQPDLPEHNRRRKDEIKVEEPRATGEKTAKVRKLGAKASGFRKRSSGTPISRERPQRRIRASQASRIFSRYGEDGRIKSEPTDKTMGDVLDYSRHRADTEYLPSTRDNQFLDLRTTRSRKENPGQLQQRVPGPPEDVCGSSDSIACSDSPGSDEDTDDPGDPTYGLSLRVNAHSRRQYS